MRLFTIILCTAISAFSPTAFAEQVKDIPVIINGEILKTKGRLIGKSHYIDIKDLSDAMKWKYQATSSAISITTPTEINEAPSAEVRGSITYFFNDNFGAKPDTGAKIYLIMSDEYITISPDENFISYEDKFVISSADSEKRTYTLAAKAAADGNGSYLIKGLKPGNYFVIIRSSHSRALNYRDTLGRVFYQQITIRKDASLDASHDFRASEF